MNRLTVVTLGVADLETSARFYSAIFDTPPNRDHEDVVFFPLPGCWISLYPLEKLAEDISEETPRTRSGFSGITLAHNARSQEEVVAILDRARTAGARVDKEPQDTFWGGFSGYFRDPNGYHWEIVWGPMFEFTADGALKFKE
ncbi:VOC family protein [Luteolibacter ambystomatis]|uniref:VOC family protein n=1 Tax=Luteolibacter ambystomatis TaxID=2824561 RepID=A0A975IYV5_9BACT|nr:VOC family protein [Luteolibacter ambystomatis]QUE50806.1 VOC family protein [Luteolibacter ambystomatis]